MSTVICDVKKCPYRSTKPLKKYKKSGGEQCYQCKLDIVIIDNLYDPDGETLGLFGYTPSECKVYARYREQQNER